MDLRTVQHKHQSRSERIAMIFSYHKQLFSLQKQLMQEYISYKQGDITEEEYLIRAKPIDMGIGTLEMSILRDTLGLKESFLPHIQKPKS